MTETVKDQGEGQKALAFFHALILAGVVLAPLSVSLDLKRPLAFAWAGIGLFWIAAFPGHHFVPRRAFLLGLAGFLIAWGSAWVFSGYRNAAGGRFENQVMFCAVAFVAATQSQQQRRVTIWAWVLAAVLVFLLAGSQAIGVARAWGTFGNPLFLGGFALMGAFLGCALLGVGGLGVLTWVAFAVGVWVSGSRAAWVMAFLQVIFLALSWARWRPTESGGQSLAWSPVAEWAVLALFAAFIDWTRPTERLTLWRESLRLWVSSPLVGHGPGSFPLAFQATVDPGFSGQLGTANQFAEHPHNWVLSLASEGGLFVLAAFGAVVFMVMRWAWKGSRQEENTFDARLGLAGLAGVAAFLGENLFDRSLEVAGVAFFFWILVGCMAAPDIRSGKPLALGIPSRMLAAGLGLGLLILGAGPLWTARQAAADPGGPEAVEDPGADLALRAHLKDQPGDSAAWEILGSNLAGQLRYGEAAEAYARALALDPRSHSAAANLGHSRLMSSDFTGAEATFRQALRLKPGYAEGHFSLGVALFYQRRLREAVAELDRCLKIEPGHARARQLKTRMLE